MDIVLDYREIDKEMTVIGFDEARNFFIGPLENEEYTATTGSSIKISSKTTIVDIPKWYAP